MARAPHGKHHPPRTYQQGGSIKTKLAEATDRSPSRGTGWLAAAVSHALGLHSTGEPSVRLTSHSTLSDTEDALKALRVPPSALLQRAALKLLRSERGQPLRNARDELRFIMATRRPSGERRFTAATSTVSWYLEPEVVLAAMVRANAVLELLSDISDANGVQLFGLLGLRNLSSLVGSVFARELQLLDKDRLRTIPQQDGYPDLMALTPEGREYIAKCEADGMMTAKKPWSPYPAGGIEVKTTCGKTPPAKVLAKPEIGMSRLSILVGLDWKSHHRNTNNLLATFWDFLDGLPTMLAAFYRNDLSTDDWGKVVKPKKRSKATSVSVMKRKAVKKMGKGWLVLPVDQAMLSSLSQKRALDLQKDDIERFIKEQSLKEGPVACDPNR